LPQAPDIAEVPSLESVAVADPEAVSSGKKEVVWANPHIGDKREECRPDELV
jgi:hypothetical protein